MTVAFPHPGDPRYSNPPLLLYNFNASFQDVYASWDVVSSVALEQVRRGGFRPDLVDRGVFALHACRGRLGVIPVETAHLLGELGMAIREHHVHTLGAVIVPRLRAVITGLSTQVTERVAAPELGGGGRSGRIVRIVDQERVDRGEDNPYIK